MSNDQRALIAHVRTKINELRSLLADSDQTTRLAGSSDSESSSTIANQLEQQISQAEKQELARLTASLRWLESDDGGYCEDCGCEIPVDRLRAVPTTRLCIKCAA